MLTLMIVLCIICVNFTLNYTPYHYKFVLMKCVLLVPDKFVPEIGRKHIFVVRPKHIYVVRSIAVKKNFLAGFLFRKAVKKYL